MNKIIPTSSIGMESTNTIPASVQKKELKTNIPTNHSTNRIPPILTLNQDTIKAQQKKRHIVRTDMFSNISSV
jgi:hypothetical protein